MTRKDYRSLGRALIRARQTLKSRDTDHINWIMEVLIKEMSNAFKADNIAFDRGKFYRYVMEDE
jgi:hypothetical protein